jgi:hypothetical protein
MTDIKIKRNTGITEQLTGTLFSDDAPAKEEKR